MLKVTDTEDAPWLAAYSNDKRRAWFNVIPDLLGRHPAKEESGEKTAPVRAAEAGRSTASLTTDQAPHPAKRVAPRKIFF